MNLTTTTPPESDEQTRLAEAIIDGLGTTGPLSGRGVGTGRGPGPPRARCGPPLRVTTPPARALDSTASRDGEPGQRGNNQTRCRAQEAGRLAEDVPRRDPRGAAARRCLRTHDLRGDRDAHRGPQPSRLDLLHVRSLCSCPGSSQPTGWVGWHRGSPSDSRLARSACLPGGNRGGTLRHRSSPSDRHPRLCPEESIWPPTTA